MDVWLTAEEWEIGRMFTGSKKTGRTESDKTMGLASIAVDVKNEVAYTAPALGQTGYEKLMPINLNTKTMLLSLVLVIITIKNLLLLRFMSA